MNNEKCLQIRCSRGFIQIPLLFLLVLGVFVATAGTFAIKHFSKPQSVPREQAIATTTENIPCASNGVDCLFATTQKSEEAPKPSPASKPTLKPEDEKTSSTTPVSPASEQDILTIKGELLAELDNDTSDFSTLLDNVRASKADWVKYSQNAANQRASSLDTLAGQVSNSDFKQYLTNDTNTYRKYASDAPATYNDLYKPIEDVIAGQISTTTALRAEVWDTLPSQDLQDRAAKLLADNDAQKSKFLAYAQKANDAAYSVENKKSDYFLQDLDGIRSLIASYAAAASVSQQLSLIQQQAQEALAPKEPLQCTVTSQPQGSILSGKYTTTIRCNQ